MAHELIAARAAYCPHGLCPCQCPICNGPRRDLPRPHHEKGDATHERLRVPMRLPMRPVPV